MSDINPDTPTPPTVVNPSPIGAQIGTAGRDVLMILAALPALIAVFGTRDIVAIARYFGSNEGLQIAGVILAAGTALYRQWLTRRERAVQVLGAVSAPGTAVIVKEQTPHA